MTKAWKLISVSSAQLVLKPVVPIMFELNMLKLLRDLTPQMPRYVVETITTTGESVSLSAKLDARLASSTTIIALIVSPDTSGTTIIPACLPLWASSQPHSLFS